MHWIGSCVIVCSNLDLYEIGSFYQKLFLIMNKNNYDYYDSS